MLLAGNACEFFLKIKPTWRICALDVVGMLEGNLVSLNPDASDLKDVITIVSIMVEVKLKGYKNVVRILNVYDPYHDRILLWD